MLCLTYITSYLANNLGQIGSYIAMKQFTYICYLGYLPLRQTGLTYHIIVEAFKFAYAHRSLLGDPRNNPIITDVSAKLYHISHMYCDIL